MYKRWLVQEWVTTSIFSQQKGIVFTHKRKSTFLHMLYLVKHFVISWRGCKEIKVRCYLSVVERWSCHFITNLTTWWNHIKSSLSRLLLNHKRKPCQTSAHPQWKEATSLHRVRELIQPSKRSEKAPPYSHWRKTTQVHTMRLCIFTSKPP